jgi:hypothetical protein
MTLFSAAAVCLAIRNPRFMGLVAISLVFVYAERREPKEVGAATEPLALGLLRIIGLGAAGLFITLGAAFNVVSTYGELRSESRLATHTLAYAPALCALPLDGGDTRVPLICGHGVESYISFRPNSRFRPLLDSGLGHFSSETKRYYFFAWSEPDAFRLALQHLRIDYVLVNKDTYQWLPILSTLPDWQFVTCDENGVLFQRSKAGHQPLTEAQRALVTDCIAKLRDRGVNMGAFAYSTLLDDPAASLDLLEGFSGPIWSAGVFNAVCDWVNQLPDATVQAYLMGNHPHSYALVDAILAYRLGPEAFDSSMRTMIPGAHPWYLTALAAENAVREGDAARARQLFDSISPVPASSSTYYRLRNEIALADHGGKARTLGTYGQWQTWDASGPGFITAMSDRLNERLAEIAQRPDP